MTIRRLFPKRADLVPPYSPTVDGSLDHLGHEVNRWARRILTLVTVLGVFGTAASYSGWKQFGPSARFDSLQANITSVRTATAADISAVRDTAIATSKRVDSLERDLRSALYVSCELLRRSQPRAIPPDECSDGAQKARRAR